MYIYIYIGTATGTLCVGWSRESHSCPKVAASQA